MRVLINQVEKLAEGYCVVFSSDYGSATAIWKGIEPQKNKEYYVEIEVPGILYWQKDIIVTDMNCEIEELYSGIAYLVGVLESIEDDGYTVVRIGDSIIAIETKGIPPEIGSYIKIAVKSNTILLYVYTL